MERRCNRHGIELTLEQARAFDEQLRFEIASASAEKMAKEPNEEQ